MLNFGPPREITGRGITGTAQDTDALEATDIRRLLAGCGQPYGPDRENVVVRTKPWGEVLTLKGYAPWAGRCGVLGTLDKEGGPCSRLWGAGTWHTGSGRCAGHGGNRGRGSTEGWLLKVHAFARFQHKPVWEAMRDEVSRSAHAVEWLQQKLGEAPDDDSLLPGGEFYPWVVMWDKQRGHALTAYKETMRLGLDAMLADTSRIDGARIVKVLSQSLENASLTESQREVILSNLRGGLEELARAHAGPSATREQIEDQRRD